MKRLVLKFMEHGLLWAIVVWAAAVALMAVNTEDAGTRWAFVALSATGFGLVALINWARKKLQPASAEHEDGSK